MLFVSEELEKGLREAVSKFVTRKHALALALSFAAGSAVGALLKQPLVATAGFGLQLYAWLVYRNVLKRKIEAVEEAWNALITLKGLESKAIQLPERRKELLELINRKKASLQNMIKKVERLTEESEGDVMKAFALYGLGAGLSASSLSSNLPSPFNAVSYVLFSSLMLAPAPTLAAQLREVVVRKG